MKQKTFKSALNSPLTKPIYTINEINQNLVQQAQFVGANQVFQNIKSLKFVSICEQEHAEVLQALQLVCVTNKVPFGVGPSPTLGFTDQIEVEQKTEQLSFEMTQWVKK